MIKGDIFFFRKHMTDFSANRKKNDLGVLQLNLDMNLNHLFDWNVKQLFLYLIAEYVTPENVSVRLDLILK